ncbi:MAG: flagellar protein FlhE [Citrobacter freundii]|nr:flagellar protein FlhE [Citrobacter freundii]
MRKLLWVLFFPLVAQAAGEGAWQASGMGITLNHRGQSASSEPLVPGQPVSGLMTLVAWRYELNGPTPAGLRVRLCSQSRCVELDGQSGTTNGFNNVPAIDPALRIQSNQVIVNYR